jgi:transcriptional regulator with XRE-family HTH domain
MIGNRIKEKRIEKGLTQAKLAERIGVSQQSVGQWEKESTTPDEENLKKIQKD